MIHEKSTFPKPGDMRKEVYDTNNNGIVDNAERVNGHTVDSDVPEGAEFTDTTYSEASSEAAGLMSASDKAKLDGLVFDEEITENSSNLVSSGVLFTALAGKQDALTMDEVPTEDSENMVSSGAVFTALATKQETLSFDTVPTENSSNPVTSGAVFSALNAKQDTIQSASIIKVYLDGTEMNLAEALNAVIAMIGNNELTSVFSCDSPLQNNAENPDNSEPPDGPENPNDGENSNG